MKERMNEKNQNLIRINFFRSFLETCQNWFMMSELVQGRTVPILSKMKYLELRFFSLI